MPCVFESVKKDNLYLVFSKGPTVATCLLAKATKGWLWHRRFGHACMKNLKKLVKHKHIEDIGNVKFNKDRLCSACEAVKQVKSKYPKRQ